MQFTNKCAGMRKVHDRAADKIPHCARLGSNPLFLLIFHLCCEIYVPGTSELIFMITRLHVLIGKQLGWIGTIFPTGGLFDEAI